MEKHDAIRNGKAAETNRRWKGPGALVAVVLSILGCPAMAAAAGSEFQGPTEPAKAPKGVKLAIISCSATLKGCQVPAEAAVEAAKALGWQAAIFDGKANPKTQASAMLDALAWGATFILASSVDYRSIQLPLTEAKKAGVPVASVGQGGDTPARPTNRPSLQTKSQPILASRSSATCAHIPTLITSICPTIQRRSRSRRPYGRRASASA
jgi:hypothetical protein